MTEASLLKRLQTGQDASTIFFADAGDRSAIARAVCALLNTEAGGAIFVGVGPKGGLKPIEISPSGVRALEAELKNEISPLALYSVTAESISSGGIVLTIEVPAGSDRPYVAEDTMWVRDEREIRAAKPADIRAMFNARPEIERWERRLSKQMEEDDLDLTTVRNMRDSAKKSGRLQLDADFTDLEFLRELGYVRASGFTNAGDVVFAQNPARRLAQTRVQLLSFETDKVADAYKDVRSFEGPLPKVARAVYGVLQTYNETTAVFRSGSMEREDRRRYDDLTLREGIVNALAHRSYESHSGGVKVSIYPDRIEFWNSGRLPAEIKIKDLPRKHQSFPVNPDIAHAMYLDGLMDKVGRGAERIAEACKDLGAKPPVWAQDDSGVTLTIFAAVGAEDVRRDELNDRQNAFLAAVPAGETVTMAQYLSRFAEDVDRRQASRDLVQLESFRLVRKEGAGRSTVYRRLDS